MPFIVRFVQNIKKHQRKKLRTFEINTLHCGKCFEILYLLVAGYQKTCEQKSYAHIFHRVYPKHL